VSGDVDPAGRREDVGLAGSQLKVKACGDS
jgi:hypothetical protein